MKVFLLSILLAMLPKAQAQTEIINGEPVTTVLPWFVRQLTCDSNGANCFTCGATLVHEDIVLTAAHCVDTYNLVPTLAVIGALNVDWSTFTHDGTQISPVSGSLSVHPNWNTNDIQQGFDLAMYKISPVTNAKAFVNGNAAVPANGQQLLAVGHGLTANGGAGSNALMALFAPAQVPCPSTVSPHVPDQHVCFMAPAGSGVCSGDSGGPLLEESTSVDNAVTVGVASFVFGPAGANCGSENPDVYMDVSFFHDWINDYICNNSASPPSCGCTVSNPCPITPAPTPSPTPAPTPAPTPTAPAPTPAPADTGCNGFLGWVRQSYQHFTGSKNSGNRRGLRAYE